MKPLSHCPACQGELTVTEYQCPRCDITIRGRFDANGLGALSSEQLDFVRVFLCSEGNIREVERRMKISYPTVKNRLAEITRVLCGNEPEEAPNPQSALNDLSQGKINVEQALARILQGGTK
jgi:hypothetical protein